MAKIILGFQGSGKSWFIENHPEYDCADMDFKYYPHTEDWIKSYVDDIEKNLPEKDLIFCNISKELMQELCDRGIDFYVFAPDSSSEDYEDIKALIIGRCILRKTQTAGNIGWIEKVKAHFDEWCSPDFFKKYSFHGCWIKLTLSVNSIESVIMTNVIRTYKSIMKDMSDFDDVYVYVPESKCVIKIAEGTGDNLLKEDIAEGYVDYAIYDIFNITDDNIDFDTFTSKYEDVKDPDDGGMLMYKELIRDKYNKLEQIVPAILEEIGIKDQKYILL